MNKDFKDFETILNEHQDTMAMLIRKELSDISVNISFTNDSEGFEEFTHILLSKVPVISYRTSLELLKDYHLWLTSENDK